MNLSEEQQQILNLLTIDFLTPKQIAYRRHTTIWAVYKTINKLKEKGIYLGGTKGGVQNRGVTKSGGGTKTLRLHNIQLDITIIKSSNFYARLLKKRNKVALFNSTVMLYADKVEVFTGVGVDFRGYTTEDCYKKALDYLASVLYRIENRFKISLLKDQYLNINWVRQHIAEMDSETAKDYQARGESIGFKAEDGKTWLLTDRSLNGSELEFIHPRTAKPDTDKVEKQLNDWRKFDPPTNSQLATHVLDVIKAQSVYNDNIVLHLDTLNKMQIALDNINNYFNELRKVQK